jgi:hypothetical protein
MHRFIKHNKVITAYFVVSFVVISLYILSLNETEWFPHVGDWFNVLFQLSIGFVINFIFGVVAVINDSGEGETVKTANLCMKKA